MKVYINWKSPLIKRKKDGGTWTKEQTVVEVESLEELQLKIGECMGWVKLMEVYKDGSREVLVNTNEIAYINS